MPASPPPASKIDAIPTNHYFVYWVVTAAVAAVVAAVVIHYLKIYDPLGELPWVTKHPDQ